MADLPLLLDSAYERLLELVLHFELAAHCNYSRLTEVCVAFGRGEGYAADDEDQHQRRERIAHNDHKYGEEATEEGHGVGVTVADRRLGHH